MREHDEAGLRVVHAGSPCALGARSTTGQELLRILTELPDVAGIVLGKVVLRGLRCLFALFNDVRNNHAFHAIDVDRLIGDRNRVCRSVGELVEPSVAHCEGHELVGDWAATEIAWVEWYV